MIKVDPYKFGENLRRLRTLKGMSQHQLADAINMTNVNISRVESGNRVGHLQSAVRLAHALGVTVNDLLDGAIVEVDEWLS